MPFLKLPPRELRGKPITSCRCAWEMLLKSSASSPEGLTQTWALQPLLIFSVTHFGAWSGLSPRESTMRTLAQNQVLNSSFLKGEKGKQ